MSKLVIGGADGVVVIHLVLHQCIRGSNLAPAECAKWLSQSMLALASGFLPDLQFPPAFKIGTCLAQSNTPPHPGEWGAAVLKVYITI